ncbi:hypothetical protein ACLOJK_032089 [Asimina triloba]
MAEGGSRLGRKYRGAKGVGSSNWTYREPPQVVKEAVVWTIGMDAMRIVEVTIVNERTEDEGATEDSRWGSKEEPEPEMTMPMTQGVEWNPQEASSEELA